MVLKDKQLLGGRPMVLASILLVPGDFFHDNALMIIYNL